MEYFPARVHSFWLSLLCYAPDPVHRLFVIVCKTVEQAYYTSIIVPSDKSTFSRSQDPNLNYCFKFFVWKIVFTNFYSVRIYSAIMIKL